MGDTILLFNNLLITSDHMCFGALPNETRTGRKYQHLKSTITTTVTYYIITKHFRQEQVYVVGYVHFNLLSS